MNHKKMNGSRQTRMVARCGSQTRLTERSLQGLQKAPSGKRMPDAAGAALTTGPPVPLQYSLFDLVEIQELRSLDAGLFPDFHQLRRLEEPTCLLQ